jgi:hypothetical protein
MEYVYQFKQAGFAIRALSNAICILQTCLSPSAPERSSRGASLPKTPRPARQPSLFKRCVFHTLTLCCACLPDWFYMHITCWCLRARALSRECLHFLFTLQYMRSAAGAAIRNGDFIIYPGTRFGARRHHLEHNRGRFILWQCYWQDAQESHPTCRRLQRVHLLHGGKHRPRCVWRKSFFISCHFSVASHSIFPSR